MRPALVRTVLVSLASAIVLIVATLVIGGAVQAVLRVPDLYEWHRYVPEQEIAAADIDDSFGLDQYLRREEALFAEVQAHLGAKAGPTLAGVSWNRFVATSPSAPARAPRDWNRTFEVVPPVIRAGALMIHGLTDSPYSMRALADDLQSHGVYSLVLRMPGHGTVPGALTEATSEDWMAAVRMGARHVSSRVGADRPLILVGYSNGGALAARYAIEALQTQSLPAPSAVVLVSQMIGVSPMARLARFISVLAPVPMFEKAGWLDVVEEYNPFKYNSFPANAGLQTWRLTTTMTSQIERIAAAGRSADLPPLLTFHSLVDATVSTPAVVHALYDVIADNRSELVLFDINRSSGLVPFIQPWDAALVSRLTDANARRYRRTLITNVDPSALDVTERTVAPGATTVSVRPLGLAWPRDVYSLSHVAIPFPMTDPVYGREASEGLPAMIRLGLLSPRGERAVLSVPSDTLMRLTCNPFFPYMRERMTAWLDEATAHRP